VKHNDLFNLPIMILSPQCRVYQRQKTPSRPIACQKIENNTVFEFGQGSNRNPAPQFRAGWLPDGYELVKRYSDSIVTWFYYQNSDTDVIWVNYSLGEGTSISVDTEDAVTEYVDIHGNKVLLISKKGSLQLIWGIENPAAFIQIIGAEVSRENSLHRADQLTC